MTKTRKRLEQLEALDAKAAELTADIDEQIDALKAERKARLKDAGILDQIRDLEAKVRKQVLISERTFKTDTGKCQAVFSISRRADLDRLEADGLTGYLAYKPRVSIRRYSK